MKGKIDGQKMRKWKEKRMGEIEDCNRKEEKREEKVKSIQDN